MDALTEVLLPKLEGVRQFGGYWKARCPAHEDREASMTIGRGTSHPVVIRCHAGCMPDDILAKIGLTWDDLCAPRDEQKPQGEWTPHGEAVAVYDYRDEAGKLLFQVLRTATKSFPQRVPDAARKSGWRWSLGDTRRVLYRLPKVIEAVGNGELVYVCYADDTEVLTPSGWVLMAKLPAGAQVAQYDGGQVSFAEPSARQVFDYEGPMVSIDADWSGLLVTPDHRTLCRWRGSKPVTIRAADVKAQRWLPVAGVRPGTGSGPTADEARLLAAWQADGVDCPRGHRVAWNLRKDRKKDRLRKLLAALGIEWREQEFPSTSGWTYFTIDRRDAPVLGHLPGKRFGWDVLDWPEASRHALLDELGYWDGDRPGREGVRYFTADEQCAEVVSAVAATTGWGAIVRKDDRPERPEQAPQWVVSLVPRDWRTLGIAPGREDYDGRVYCLTVPSGYLVTRRNGKVTVCGNCEGEKDVHALEAAGVTATCNPGGAGKWRPEYAEFLREAAVIIIADKDKPGQAHARQVAASLEDIAGAVEIQEAAGDLKDASDHLRAGRTLAELEVTWRGDDAVSDLAPDLYEFISIVDPPSDWVIPELLERGDRLIWTGFEGLGKALALDTPVPTPKGWTTMGELSIGDQVFGADGRPARVTMATPVMTGHDCYRVVFSDGAEIVADADHLWLTETLPAREAHQRYLRKGDGPLRKRGTDQRGKRCHFPEVVTTEQIRDTLMARGGHAVNHSVQTCEPLQYPAQELPIDPYVLGAWLGDGTSRNSQITSADIEIVEEIRKAGEVCRHLGGYQWSMSSGALGNRSPHTMTARLRALGLIMNKHIPALYLQASTEQRLALLQGLMDTDGTVTESSGTGRGTGAASCEFSVTSEPLARDAYELMISLGIKVKFREGRAVLEGRHIGTRYRLCFQTDLPVFRLPRKAERLTPLRTRRAKLRYITAVEPVDSVPVRCIRVDNDDHMFLAGRECIPTHNSVVIRQLAVCAAAGVHPFTDEPITPQRVLFIDCENPDRKSRRHFRNLERIARGQGHPVPEGALRILQKPAGIDLTREEDAAWLLERVTAHRPGLLVCGPFYRLHATDANEEKSARLVVAALDAARVKADCALITEAHAGHGDGINRSIRPTGSSLLMRWPEFGYGIKPQGETDENGRHRLVSILPWRGPREERHWPRELMWGTHEFDWPWKSADGLNLPH